MKSYTLINGVSRQIKGGKCCINGVSHKIKKGNACVNAVSREIKFEELINLTISSSGNDTITNTGSPLRPRYLREAYITVNGTTYTSAGTHQVPKGATVVVYANSYRYRTSTQTMYFPTICKYNGTKVGVSSNDVGDSFTQLYSFTMNNPITLNLFNDDATATDDLPINITEV